MCFPSFILDGIHASRLEKEKEKKKKKENRR
jgi:hypothetical protein